MDTRTRSESVTGDALPLTWTREPAQEQPAVKTAPVSSSTPSPLEENPELELYRVPESLTEKKDSQDPPAPVIPAAEEIPVADDMAAPAEAQVCPEEPVKEFSAEQEISTAPENNDVPSEETSETPEAVEASEDNDVPSGEETAATTLSEDTSAQQEEDDSEAAETQEEEVDDTDGQGTRLEENDTEEPFRTTPEVVDLTREPSSVGSALAAYRSQAMLTEETLADELGVSAAYIRALECGDYSEIHEFFFLKRHVKRICRKLSIPAETEEKLLVLLAEEYKNSYPGQPFEKEDNLEIPTGAEQEADGKNNFSNRLFKSLPAVLLGLVVIALICTILLAVVLPVIRKYKETKKPRIDLAPLVPQVPESPSLVPIPQK